MENKFRYLHSIMSDVGTIDFSEQLILGTLRFEYDLNDAPHKLGIVVTFLKDTVFDKVDLQILKAQSNFDIVRNTSITGEELYPLIKHSIEMGNIHLKEAALKGQIPDIEVSCPLWVDMKMELDDLANDLNK